MWFCHHNVYLPGSFCSVTKSAYVFMEIWNMHNLDKKVISNVQECHTRGKMYLYSLPSYATMDGHRYSTKVISFYKTLLIKINCIYNIYNEVYDAVPAARNIMKMKMNIHH